MKIIINTSNLVVGGGVQVALSFLEELKEIGKDEYFVFLSPQVGGQLDLSSFPENFRFFHFEKSPARLTNRWRVVGRMKELERSIRPEVVFSVFGPSYWRPKAPHVVGFALGWAINPASVAYSRLGIKEYVRMRLINAHAKFFVKRDGDFLIGETQAVKKKLVQYGWAAADKIHVVGNTCHKVFDGEGEFLPLPVLDDKFRFVTVSAMYRHKNLEILRDVVPILQETKTPCRFYLTLPPAVFEREFSGFEEWVTNIGPITIQQCPSVYRQCHALFLPTLLECFSASYPEAMKSDLPILTSDLDFARAICGEAAEYFDPLDPNDIAEKIQRMINDSARQKELIQLGRERLRNFPTPRQRAEAYLDICRMVSHAVG